MKIHIANPSPLFHVFIEVLGNNLADEIEKTENHEDATIIMTNDTKKLHEFYKKYDNQKFFIFFDTTQDVISMSEDNIFSAGKEELSQMSMKTLIPIIAKYHNWAKTRGNQTKKVEKPQSEIISTFKGYKILVVDDRKENLEIATERLVGQQIVLANSPAEGFKYLKMCGSKEDSFDVVLTDLNMKPDNMYGSSLNLSQYSPTAEVPAGLSIMFEATKRGIPVAIVTDANHHQDWFSAMFDHCKESEVNGQKVVFYSGGKEWDFALKRLMEKCEE